jgi:DNA-binding transcriptional LysR family regulator
VSSAGVQAAVGAGLGVALTATTGQTPEGLVPRTDLPTPEPLRLYVCARRGLPEPVVAQAVAVVRPLLASELVAAS